jgi:hypothetical protein
MIRRAAVIIAMGAAALAFVTVGTRGDEVPRDQPASAPPAALVPTEDPYVAWWRFASTSPDAPGAAAVEDPYIAWWKFATTSQDVVVPE